MKDETRRTQADRDEKRGVTLRWVTVAIDVLLIAAILVGFAWWHHGARLTGNPAILVSPRYGHAYTVTDEDFVADNGGERGLFDFEGRFQAESPTITQSDKTTYYADDGAEIAIATYYLTSGEARVADVYISDISRLKTAMANDTYGKGQREDAEAMTLRSDAIFSITGDNYSERWGGVVMRNGVLYSRKIDSDVCVLNWDGSVDMASQWSFDLAEAIDNGAYQIWSCGPIVLENGKVTAAAEKDQGLSRRRAALGYYEPGHYCFVIMEGEVTLEQLALNMQALGCESAYNLYGGHLAEMNFDGQVISSPQEVNRTCADIILITK